MRLQLLLVPPELAEMQFKNYVGVSERACLGPYRQLF
jgi:hypothetical protein